MIKILLVEDDPMIASGLVYALTQEGYQVNHCRDMRSAQAAIRRAGAYSLALLDLSLPDGTGFELCGRLQECQVPIIFLTAADDEGNVVQGLELGAEDYITKPFRLRELLARVAGVLRRHGSAAQAQAVIAVGGGIRIHTLQAKVLVQGKEVELTALEYRLLLTLASRKGQLFTREQLLQSIWDVAGSFVEDNTLSVYIKRLREKLGDNSQNPRIIKTVRGMGYQIDG